jgi:hypothetical protein
MSFEKEFEEHLKFHHARKSFPKLMADIDFVFISV